MQPCLHQHSSTHILYLECYLSSSFTFKCLILVTPAGSMKQTSMISSDFNREVAQVYSGVFPALRIQSECRCPGTYPRVKPGQPQSCIKNGVLPTTSDVTPRISRDAHPLEYTNDGDSNSMWISGFQNEVEIDIDLGDQFQVFLLPLAVKLCDFQGSYQLFLCCDFFVTQPNII